MKVEAKARVIYIGSKSQSPMPPQYNSCVCYMYFFVGLNENKLSFFFYYKMTKILNVKWIKLWTCTPTSSISMIPVIVRNINTCLKNVIPKLQTWRQFYEEQCSQQCNLCLMCLECSTILSLRGTHTQWRTKAPAIIENSCQSRVVTEQRDCSLLSV